MNSSQTSNSIVLVLTAWTALVLPACRGSQPLESVAIEPSATEVITSSTPPFSTREPERYQAVRTITISGATPATPSQTTTVFIAREGPLRREEYEMSNKRLVYLETMKGRFVLSPSEKLFADLNAVQEGPGQDSSDPPAVVPGIFSFHPSLSESRYQRLGHETIVGRPTTKYRVTHVGNTDGTSSEALIWVDELLGLPIRSEMRHGRAETPAVVMVLSDISVEVDARLFDLPEDYKLVQTDVILGRRQNPK